MAKNYMFILVLVISGLAVGCFFAVFKRSISNVLNILCLCLVAPFENISRALAILWQGVVNFYRQQLSNNGVLDLQHTFYIIIGSILYTAFFLDFTVSEYYLLRLSLAGVGIDDPINTIPLGANSLTALAILSCFLFWGAMLTDLAGITETTNWAKSIDRKWKITLYIITITCLILSIFVAASLGKFRGEATLSNGDITISNSPTGGFSDLSTGIQTKMLPMSQVTKENPYAHIIILANVCIPILVGIGGIFAGWGIINFIKFAMLLAGFIIISPFGIALILSSFICQMMNWIYRLLVSVVDFLSDIGVKFLGIFGWEPDIDPQDKDEDQDPPPSSTGDCEEDNNSTEMPKDGWDPFNE